MGAGPEREEASVHELPPRPVTWRGRAWAFAREHPVTVVVFLVGLVAGAVGAVVLPVGDPDMPLALRVVGGAIFGACLAMFPLGFRLFD